MLVRDLGFTEQDVALLSFVAEDVTSSPALATHLRVVALRIAHLLDVDIAEYAKAQHALAQSRTPPPQRPPVAS